MSKIRWSWVGFAELYSRNFPSRYLNTCTVHSFCICFCGDSLQILAWDKSAFNQRQFFQLRQRHIQRHFLGCFHSNCTHTWIMDHLSADLSLELQDWLLTFLWSISIPRLILKCSCLNQSTSEPFHVSFIVSRFQSLLQHDFCVTQQQQQPEECIPTFMRALERLDPQRLFHVKNTQTAEFPRFFAQFPMDDWKIHWIIRPPFPNFRSHLPSFFANYPKKSIIKKSIMDFLDKFLI